MTDQEMLELAAKAAGLYLRQESDGSLTAWENNGRDEHEWNPLTDDGDALRLAVRLHIDVQQFEGTEIVEAWKYPHQASGETYGSDSYAATRRAITRAAAEVGKSLEKTK